MGDPGIEPGVRLREGVTVKQANIGLDHYKYKLLPTKRSESYIIPRQVI